MMAAQSVVVVVVVLRGHGSPEEARRLATIWRRLHLCVGALQMHSLDMKPLHACAHRGELRRRGERAVWPCRGSVRTCRPASACRWCCRLRNRSARAAAPPLLNPGTARAGASSSLRIASAGCNCLLSTYHAATQTHTHKAAVTENTTIMTTRSASSKLSVTKTHKHKAAVAAITKKAATIGGLATILSTWYRSMPPDTSHRHSHCTTPTAHAFDRFPRSRSSAVLQQLCALALQTVDKEGYVCEGQTCRLCSLNSQCKHRQQRKSHAQLFFF